MEYIYRENMITLKYQNIYLEARKDGRAKDCFIGIDKRYRIVSKDSYYDNISDMDSILEFCIYPLYLKGYSLIKEEVERIVSEMTDSNDVIQIFQVFNLIMSQEIEERMYSNIPVEIDFSSLMENLMEKKDELEMQMKEYKENGFDRFHESIWESIERICRKSQCIKKYIEHKDVKK